MRPVSWPVPMPLRSPRHWGASSVSIMSGFEPKPPVFMMTALALMTYSCPVTTLRALTPVTRSPS